jgi:peptidoglycan hydrolase-like protein with peptidoglycan-binding domain
MVEPSDQSGTPIATAAPLRLGALVEEGTVVAEIALRPVIVLSGDIPMFRDLSVASAGRDVLQLQQALVRRGLTPETDGVLGPQTVDAVAKLYAFRGYAPPNPGAQTGRGARGGPVVLKSEVIFVRGLPARLLGRPLRVGQTVQGAVARLSSGGVFVRAAATSADRGDIRIGSRATIRVSGRGVSGRVTAIGALTRKRDSDLRAHPLTIQPTKPLPRRLLDRSVQVIISARATRGRTLVVPVAAISAGADGSARLTRVRADETTPVRVRPGLSANGYVSVRTQPGDLRPGDQVVVGR